MMHWHPFEVALLAAVVLAILEVVTGTLVCLSFAAGCLATALVEWHTGDFRLGRDAIVFVAAAIIAIVITRLVFGRRGDTRRAQGDVNDY